MSFKSSFTTPAVVVISLGLIGPTFPAAADILHVPGDFLTIQEAIDAAVDGDEVEVHPGTYNETINFLGKAITVRSSDGPEVTIIDATGLNDSVVKCISREGPDTVLEGFTITGGIGTFFPGVGFLGGGMLNDNSNPTVTNCTFSENSVSLRGGGMYNNSSSPTVTDCTFGGNTATSRGGGIYNTFSSPIVNSCTFSGNTANLEGGGMYNNSGSSPTVTNCTFIGNTGASDGGGMFNSGSPAVTNCTFSGNTSSNNGAGMYNLGSGTVTNCTFSSNAAGNGGGMFNVSASLTVTNCTFSGNSASNAGGGMYIISSNPTVTNCTFSGNTAVSEGGGMYTTDGSSPTITNCTISGNSGSTGGGMYNGNSLPTITNCVLWGNIGGQISGPATVRFSDVEGGHPGTGNIDTDPLFVDPDNGEFRLSPGSPCIDAGNNWGVPIDENDYDEDGVLCELFPVDLDGNPRFNADEVDVDPGCGVPVVVDMGAYEYQFDPVDQVTFADLNGDNVVGAADLLGLLVSWGPCDKGCCLADLDINGSVGASDLLALLVNWGPCP